jgi:hypothetical protein
MFTYRSLRKIEMDRRVSKTKKKSQATDARIAWLTLAKAYLWGVGSLGECLQAYSPVFSARSCKKRQGFFQASDGS